VRLEGTLDAFSLPDIFSLLSMTKKTGGLHLHRDGAEGVVWLTEGALTGGTSNVGRALLARRLAGTGDISDGALSTAVRRTESEPGVGIARALRDARALDDNLLRDVVAEHIVDSVWDLLRWPDGGFEFVIDEPNVDDIGVARDVDEVVSEARQRLELWQALGDRVLVPDAVLSLSLVPESDPALSRDEWALLALVDGRRTVADLVTLAARGEYVVVSALAELVQRGLLRANDDDIASMLSRQQLLRTLESSDPVDAVHHAPAETLPVAPPAASAAPADVEQPEIEPREDSVADESPEPVPDPDPPVAAVQPLARPQTSGRDRSAPQQRERSMTSVPQEPFSPGRPPDQPEPMAAVAGGGTAVAPSAVIERDPSVNKSLLLRLIAGVRGL